MDYLSFASMTVYFVLYPVFLVLKAILTILLFIVAPFLHLGHYMLCACWWPFQFLAKFEVNGRILRVRSSWLIFNRRYTSSSASRHLWAWRLA